MARWRSSGTANPGTAATAANSIRNPDGAFLARHSTGTKRLASGLAVRAADISAFPRTGPRFGFGTGARGGTGWPSGAPERSTQSRQVHTGLSRWMPFWPSRASIRSPHAGHRGTTQPRPSRSQREGLGHAQYSLPPLPGRASIGTAQPGHAGARSTMGFTDMGPARGKRTRNSNGPSRSPCRSARAERASGTIPPPPGKEPAGSLVR